MSFFKGKSGAFQRKIVLLLECVEYGAGDRIIAKDELGDDTFIVLGGAVDVVDDDGDVPLLIRTIAEGGYFGENSLIYRTRRQASVIAKTHVQLFKLTRERFVESLTEFPEYEREYHTLQVDTD